MPKAEQEIVKEFSSKVKKDWKQGLKNAIVKPAIAPLESRFGGCADSLIWWAKRLAGQTKAR